VKRSPNLNLLAGLAVASLGGMSVVVDDSDWLGGRVRSPEPAPSVKEPNPERQRMAAERRARKVARQAKGFALTPKDKSHD
jgi:hypothetical protein